MLFCYIKIIFTWYILIILGFWCFWAAVEILWLIFYRFVWIVWNFLLLVMHYITITVLIWNFLLAALVLLEYSWTDVFILLLALIRLLGFNRFLLNLQFLLRLLHLLMLFRSNFYLLSLTFIISIIHHNFYTLKFFFFNFENSLKFII